MDADAFAAFEEAGDPFDRATAARLEAHILSVGGSVAPEAAYTAFRGRMPGVEALLKGRGLPDAA
jgi:peptidyl-dipeptidase Dcp